MGCEEGQEGAQGDAKGRKTGPLVPLRPSRSSRSVGGYIRPPGRTMGVTNTTVPDVERYLGGSSAVVAIDRGPCATGSEIFEGAAEVSRANGFDRRNRPSD